jgi:hypothetical protein
MNTGWFNESYRHSLAARGIKTSYYAKKSFDSSHDESYKRYQQLTNEINEKKRDREQYKGLKERLLERKHELARQVGYNDPRVKHIDDLRAVASEKAQDAKFDLKELQREYRDIEKSAQVGTGRSIVLNRPISVKREKERLSLNDEFVGLVPGREEEFRYSPLVREKVLKRERREAMRKGRELRKAEKGARVRLEAGEYAEVSPFAVPKYKKQANAIGKNTKVPYTGYKHGTLTKKALLEENIGVEEVTHVLPTLRERAQMKRQKLKMRAVEKEAKVMEQKERQRIREQAAKEYARELAEEKRLLREQGLIEERERRGISKERQIRERASLRYERPMKETKILKEKKRKVRRIKPRQLSILEEFG